MSTHRSMRSFLFLAVLGVSGPAAGQAVIGSDTCPPSMRATPGYIYSQFNVFAYCDFKRRPAAVYRETISTWGCGTRNTVQFLLACREFHGREHQVKSVCYQRAYGSHDKRLPFCELGPKRH